jgi:thioredoxin 1
MGLFSRNKRAKAHKISSLEELRPMLEGDRPILIDFYQTSCAPCQVMDGIVNELAREYPDSAHVVKADIHRVPGAAEAFKIRSTPTLIVLGKAPAKRSKKARRRNPNQEPAGGAMRLRWRHSGLVKKDELVRVLEMNGAGKPSAAG